MHIHLLIILFPFLLPFNHDNIVSHRLEGYTNSAYKYCVNNSLNTSYCILVDMQIHSGKDRFFVWDFNSDSILLKGLVSHGCCDGDWSGDLSKTNPTFSNEHDSHCSSLGRYKIGKRGYSSWGINVNYKLHGIDPSNNNAFDRLIVLHSWDMVLSEETFPKGTPEGWGCPAVSNELMKAIDNLLKNESDVLLWIY